MSATAQSAAASKSIQVRSHKNIELFGLLLQLDLGPDVLSNTDWVELDGRKAQWRDWYQPAVRNYQRFQSHFGGPMMKLYREYLSRSFYNDFLIGFLLQVDEVPVSKIRPDTDPEILLAFSKTKDRAEAEKNAIGFLNALNGFFKEIRFDDYLSENRADYEQMLVEVNKHLPPPAFIAAMESFYQKSFNRYCLVPSLTIPTSMGFGKTHKAAGAIYNVFGPFSFQSLEQKPPAMGFDHAQRVLNLSVHEFGHSFVNPVVDKVPVDLILRTEPLFAPIRDAMAKQSYPTWTICLYEHFVRAGEVIIARKIGNQEEAGRILAENAKNHFIYLPAIVAELERYDQNRAQGQHYDETVSMILEKLLPVERR